MTISIGTSVRMEKSCPQLPQTCWYLGALPQHGENRTAR